MTDKNNSSAPSGTPLSAARHAVYNLKEFRAGRTTFPGEAISILENFLEGCSTQPPAYLAPASAQDGMSPMQACDEVRDAERYRWLREQDWFSGPLCVLRDPKRVLTQGIGLGADCPSHSRLDEAIDALRATNTEGEEQQ